MEILSSLNSTCLIWKLQVHKKQKNVEAEDKRTKNTIQLCIIADLEKNLTIDLKRSKGGTDFTKNVVCCCHNCNQSKSHNPWEEWYFAQDFFSYSKYNKITEWMEPEPPKNLFVYRPRKNSV